MRANEDGVTPSIDEGTMILPAVPHVRQGWAEAAREMARRGDDAFLDPVTPTSFDQDEWEW
jgi:hypothetical protein